MNQQLPLGSPRIEGDKYVFTAQYDDPATIVYVLSAFASWLRARLREEGARPGRRVVVRVEFE